MSVITVYVETNPETLLLSDDDRAVLRLLATLGLAHRIIDLTLTGGAARHFAEQLGVRSTPTLICENQKFDGLKQITDMLKNKTVPAQKQ